MLGDVIVIIIIIIILIISIRVKEKHLVVFSWLNRHLMYFQCKQIKDGRAVYSGLKS